MRHYRSDRLLQPCTAQLLTICSQPSYNTILLLQRSTYTPVAKLTGSRTVGSAATFIVSGLFHEVMFAAMMLNNSPAGAYQFGEALAFFMLMFAACCLPWWDTAAVTEV
jgi:hypothetical protein